MGKVLRIIYDESSNSIPLANLQLDSCSVLMPAAGDQLLCEIIDDSGYAVRDMVVRRAQCSLRITGHFGPAQHLVT